MRTLLLASAAALMLTGVPTALVAQDSAPETPAADSYTLTAEQQAIFDAWASERQSEYLALDAAQQTYFWTLTPSQQDAWWVLTPAQRTQVVAMTPAARASAWASIENQIRAGANASDTSVAARTEGEVPAPAQSAAEANAQTADRPATTTVVPGDADTPTRVVRNDPGNLTSPPASALNKTYPVCTRQIQDSCQNPGEGGAPGRSRALGYWPGEPASERSDRGG